ncbi:MAG TPA: RidA family protein [Clostridia bacterium]|mgnify:CR=1 FL=1|nr:RidA family protein [Clostridia bacterium]
MKKEIVETKNAPGAIGPYSQAVKAGNMLFLSGQLPIDASAGTMPEGITEQTRQSLRNAASIIESTGAGLSNVVKTTVFLSDINNFASMNEVYKEFFTEAFPARSAVEVARLPKDALVEIEMIVVY